MNCGDFERIWNERLDAPDLASQEAARSLDEHAAACASCRALGAGYQSLSRAILALPPSPPVPADFVERVLAEVALADAPRPTLALRMPRRLIPLAAAAALVAAVGLSLRSRPPEAHPASRPESVARAAPEPLIDVLADAGTATLDLAREASAPAARLGRQVIALGPEESADDSPEPPAPAGMDSVSEVWKGVEDRIEAGARPLGGSARHAFGFLFDVAPEDGQPPARPANGA